MLSLNRRTLISIIAGGFVIIAVTALLLPHYFPQQREYSFISYRYAQNLHNGLGFVYNLGERTLHPAVSPLYVWILSLGLNIIDDLPRLGNVIGVASIIIGSIVVFGLAYSEKTRLAAPVAAGIYIAFPLLWLSLGIDVTLWMALGLIAIWLYSLEQYHIAALFLSLSAMLRPELLILGLALTALALLERRQVGLLPVGIYGLSVLLIVIWGLTSFDVGGPLPWLPPAWMSDHLSDSMASNTIAGAGLAVWALLGMSWGWLAVLILVIPGLIRIKDHRPALAVLGWATLHITFLGILNLTVYPWTIAPIIPALAILAGLGIDWLVKRSDDWRIQSAIVSVCIVFIIGATLQTHLTLANNMSGTSSSWSIMVPNPARRNAVEAGAWLNENTPADAVIGVTENGILGYISNRAILDYHGLLQPDLNDSLRRGDPSWWLGHYLPAYIVIQTDELTSLDGYALASDSWFTGTYMEVIRFNLNPDEIPLVIFQRTEDVRPMNNMFVGMVSFPNGLTLNSIAVDFSLDPLEGGQTGRLRLEWLLNQPISEPLYVSLRIKGRHDLQAALAGRQVDFSQWPLRRLLSTYHTLDIAPGLSPGVYDLEVGIGTDPYNLIWQPVTQAKIPFQSDIFVGGVTGTQADFGDILLLGYRLVRTEVDTLEIALMWQATVAVHIDYDIIIQVRNAQGAILNQTKIQPHEGTYPTSIWSAGEKVPDNYQLDITNLPPGDYQVYVGIESPSGERLLTLEGQDVVLVGFLTIQDTP